MVLERLSGICKSSSMYENAWKNYFIFLSKNFEDVNHSSVNCQRWNTCVLLIWNILDVKRCILDYRVGEMWYHVFESLTRDRYEWWQVDRHMKRCSFKRASQWYAYCLWEMRSCGGMSKKFWKNSLVKVYGKKECLDIWRVNSAILLNIKIKDVHYDVLRRQKVFACQ